MGYLGKPRREPRQTVVNTTPAKEKITHLVEMGIKGSIAGIVAGIVANFAGL